MLCGGRQRRPHRRDLEKLPSFRGKIHSGEKGRFVVALYVRWRFTPRGRLRGSHVYRQQSRPRHSLKRKRRTGHEGGGERRPLGVQHLILSYEDIEGRVEAGAT